MNLQNFLKAQYALATVGSVWHGCDKKVKIIILDLQWGRCPHKAEAIPLSNWFSDFLGIEEMSEAKEN